MYVKTLIECYPQEMNITATARFVSLRSVRELSSGIIGILIVLDLDRDFDVGFYSPD